MRKTAAVCVAKLYDINAELVEDQGFLQILRDLICDPNPTVRAGRLDGAFLLLRLFLARSCLFLCMDRATITGQQTPASAGYNDEAPRSGGCGGCF